MVQKKNIFLIGFMLLSLASFAAPATATYFCDYENTAENGEWITWAGSSNSRMKHSTWKTGAAAFYTGEKGMYVTDLDMAGDNTHSYPKASGYTVSAYRKMTLTAGSYNVSLDYKCPTELLSVSLLRADTLDGNTIQTQTGADYAAVVKNSIIPGLKDLKSQDWMHASARTTITAAGTYLVVVTYRTSSGPDLTFGAAVDNVEVAKVQTDPTACDYTPSNLHLDLLNGYALLTWQGNAASYEVRYFNNDGIMVTCATVNDMGAVDSCRVSLADMADGVYSFMVRGLGCDNDSYSAWAYVRNKLIYDPTAHCIDYLNFDAQGVVCKYGSGNWGSGTSETMGSGTIGYTDYGSNSQYNTHTIHFKPNERDYMTENQLRTVPEGSFASVRLGSREPNNESPGSHWQSVSYTIHVTEEMGVVLFRYAYIGQTGGHTGLEQSHMRLRLTDQAGNVINGEDCGSILFISPTSDSEMALLNRNPRTAGWHKGRLDSGEGNICSAYVYWRDWTTVGVNVQDYVGQDIKIEVTNYGCGQSCHYGYCYFVLDCSEGEIKGVTCDEKPRSLRVDEGFEYRWYKPYNPDEPFYTGQNPTLDTLYISPQDTNTYYVDLMRKGNTGCYFTLHASALKRLPVAEMSFKHTPQNCVNYVTISDLSGVDRFYPSETGADSVARSYDELVKEVFTWRTSSGRSDTCSVGNLRPIEVASEGDTLTVNLAVYMKEGCSSDTTMQFIVPAIGPNVGRDTIYTVYGDSIYFEGEWYNEEGDYELTLTNWMGCDSILSLHVDYLRSETLLTIDTICEGQTYVFNTYEGRSFNFTKTGIFRDTCKSKVLDSDSIIYELYLTVHDTLVVEPTNTACTACADDGNITIDYTIPHGKATGYQLLFDDEAHAAGMLDMAEEGIDASGTIVIPVANADGTYRKPGLYTAKLTFFDKEGCADQTYLLQYDILFPSDIIFQRWDDVLSVKNAQYNGGYEFIGYQWLKDGQTLENENKSYYYAPDKLSLTSEYQVLLTLPDGKQQATCKFQVMPYAGALGVAPRNVRSGQQVVVTAPEDARVRFYNVSGMLLLTAEVPAGQTNVSVPEETGMLIVQISTAEDARSFRVNVTE